MTQGGRMDLLVITAHCPDPDSKAADCDLALPDPLSEGLSPEEQARADKFHFAADRIAYQLSHALLRQACAVLSGPEGARAWTPGQVPLSATDKGAPIVAGQPGHPALAVSLAHARGLVAVAVAPSGPDGRVTRLGIDVERRTRRPVDRGLARHAYAPEEADALGVLAEAAFQEAFLLLWTAKEAACKLSGLGLQLGLARPRIQEPDGEVACGWIEVVGDGPETGARWPFRRLASSDPRDVIAVAWDAAPNQGLGADISLHHHHISAADLQKPEILPVL
ncbi:MAG: 4'-phosphopantetheinyl transferase family protein [Rhodospirillaceae bacterium]